MEIAQQSAICEQVFLQGEASFMSWQSILQWLALGQVSQQSPDSSARSDAFPNVRLIDQFEKQHRFHDDFIAPGNAIIVNSMYSTCRGSCPGTSAKLSQLRTKLWPVFGKQLKIVSFTLEPDVDTPKVLKQYAGFYGAGEASDQLCDWFFVTGSIKDIQTLRHGMVFYDLDPKVDNDPTQHASLLFYGNAVTDKWAAMPSELPLTSLLDSIRRVAGLNFEQRYGFSRNANRELVHDAATVN